MMSVSKNVTKDNFRIVGNIEFSGDLMPIESGVHDLGSLDKRFRDIYLADHLDGSSPKIHFGDFDFTSTNIIEARDAASLANTALQPGTVDFTTDIWNLPTTLAGYGITDSYVPGDLQASGSSSLDGSATISTNDRSLVVSGTGDAVFESDIKAEDVYILGTLRLSGDMIHDVSLYPSQNNSISVGTQNNKYKSAYIAETLYIGNETFEQNDVGTIRDVQNGAYATAAQGALADSALQPEADIIVNNATLSGTLFGPSELVIDPEGFGDITGRVTILGNLQVDGEMTTVNSTSISVSGKIINLSRGSTNNTQANNSGIRVEGSEAVIKYIASTDNWNFNKHVGVNTIGSVDASLTVKQTYTGITNHDLLHVVDLTDKKRVYISDDFDLILSDGTQDITTLKSNGRIGINTSNPLVSLHVNTTDAIMLPRGSTIQRPLAPTQTQRGFIRFNNETNKIEGFGKNNVWFNLESIMDSDKDTYISAEISDGNDDDTLRFFTQGVEHMSLLPTGKLRLSTNTPTDTDPIFVIESPNPSIQFVDNTNVGNMNIQWQASESTNSGLRFFRTDPAEPEMLIDLEGNVGIGTANPVYNLHVANSSSANFLIQKTTPGGQVDGITLNSISGEDINNRTGDISLIMTGSAGDAEPALRFSTTNGAQSTKHTMFISNGRVGIGTVTPDNMLEIDAGASTNVGMTLRMGSGSGGYNDSFISFQNSQGSELFRTRFDNDSANERYVISTDNGGDTLTVFRSGSVEVQADSTSNATTGSPLHIKHPKNTISLFLGDGELTSGYGVNDYSGTIRYNGTNSGWGDISYYPTATNNLNSKGHFRFTKNGSTVSSTPNARVGVGSLYSHGDVQVEGDIQAPTVKGKLWVSSDYVLDTDIKPADFVVMEVVGWSNPNTNGRSEYKDPIHLYVYKGTGWNGSAPTDYVYCIQISPPARSQFSSGTSRDGNDIDVCWVDVEGNETDSCPNNSTTHTLKFKQTDPEVLPSTVYPNWRIRTTIKE